MENPAFLSIWREELATEIMAPLEQIRCLEAHCCDLVERLALLEQTNPEDEVTRGQMFAELQAKAAEVKQLKADLALHSRFNLYRTLTEHLALQS